VGVVTVAWLLVLAEAMTPVSSAGVATAFWARDLSGAQSQLERVVAGLPLPVEPVSGGPEQFWRELLDLADCIPLLPGLERPHVPANEWETLTALVRLERLRQRRFHGQPTLPGLQTDLMQASFFHRAAAAEAPSDAIVWPAERELWGDETLQSWPRASQCAVDAAPSEQQLGVWRDQELALLRALGPAVPPGHPAWAALRLHEAALVFEQGTLPEALAVAQPLYVNPPGGLTEPETRQAALLHAMALEHAGQSDAALAIYSSLTGVPSLTRYQPFIRARREWALASTGRHEELLTAIPEEPDLTTPLGRYEAYLRARALLSLKRFDRLIDHARRTLRRSSAEVAVSPEIGLLNDEVYSYLATVPFEDRIVEVVESLGPPNTLYPRLERLARIAALAGQFETAKATLYWLLEHHRNAQYQPRYQAALAKIAFDAGDLHGFPTLLRALAVPDEALMKAIAPGRRGQFWEQRDRQLLAVVADIVPRLAERHDDRWTAPVVSTLQVFLRDALESRATRELSELYRTARTLLGTGAPAYAERVGDQQPAIVLGEIQLPAPSLELAPPDVPAEIEEPSCLLRIPTGADPKRVQPWFADGPP
jgi:tetratricopeptide (TPR) repeat protein